jgi:uncharacterized phage protein (TIGR01671 family)
MKREILFRGYSESLNKWVQGNLINRFTDNDPMGIKYKSDFSSNLAIQVNPESFENCRIHEVHPDSVGQFTGLVDCNGVKIFEGDIVTDDEGHETTVTFFQGLFVPLVYVKHGYDCIDRYDSKLFTITGNTFKP